MTKTEGMILRGPGDETFACQCHPNGALAVHRPHCFERNVTSEDTWRVSHVPTGRRIAGDFASFDLACRVRDALLPFCDWQFGSLDSARSELSAAIEARGLTRRRVDDLVAELMRDDDLWGGE